MPKTTNSQKNTTARKAVLCLGSAILVFACSAVVHPGQWFSRKQRPGSLVGELERFGVAPGRVVGRGRRGLDQCCPWFECIAAGSRERFLVSFERLGQQLIERRFIVIDIPARRRDRYGRRSGGRRHRACRRCRRRDRDHLGETVNTVGKTLGDAGVDLDVVTEDVLERVEDGVPLEEAVDKVLDLLPLPPLPVPTPTSSGGLLGGLLG